MVCIRATNAWFKQRNELRSSVIYHSLWWRSIDTRHNCLSPRPLCGIWIPSRKKANIWRRYRWTDYILRILTTNLLAWHRLRLLRITLSGWMRKFLTIRSGRVAQMGCANSRNWAPRTLKRSRWIAWLISSLKSVLLGSGGWLLGGRLNKLMIYWDTLTRHRRHSIRWLERSNLQIGNSSYQRPVIIVVG